jgi:transposase InsO family protein
MKVADPGCDVQHLCRLAGVARATYYRHLNACPDSHQDHEIHDAVQRVCLKHRHYGYRRVTALLRRQGYCINAKKILRVMRDDNLLAQRRKPFAVSCGDRPDPFVIVPNLIRGLVPSGPDQVWVADITYVHLATTFAYLAIILDAFSRKAVGWTLDDTLDASLAIDALDQALSARKPARGSLIHHSDRGVQYASIAYRKRLEDHEVAVSMSRPGNPFDNAKAESFMKTLKAEELNARSFRRIEDARTCIAEFIDNIYNTQRLHSALGYRTPLEFEADFAHSHQR